MRRDSNLIVTAAAASLLGCAHMVNPQAIEQRLFARAFAEAIDGLEIPGELRERSFGLEVVWPGPESHSYQREESLGEAMIVEKREDGREESISGTRNRRRANVLPELSASVVGASQTASAD